MKAIEEYLSVVLFIVLYKMVISFESLDESCGAILSSGPIDCALPSVSC